jgi:hypothetical protein
MKKPRAVINVDGEDIVMDGYYRSYENLKHVSICLENNQVVSVENISEDVDVHIKNEPYVVLTPGTKVTFGSLNRRPTRDELKLVYRSRPSLNYEDEDEHYDE